jgi:two-component system, OmpR family, sensor histidine kinase KdpD
VSRLQAGSLPVFPRPADLGQVVAGSLGDFGPLAREVTVDVPYDLPDVMADPAIMERVVVNLVGNALRHAPAGSPVLLTARPSVTGWSCVSSTTAPAYPNMTGSGHSCRSSG